MPLPHEVHISSAMHFGKCPRCPTCIHARAAPCPKLREARKCNSFPCAGTGRAQPCGGTTVKGRTSWRIFDKFGIYVEVDVSGCKFGARSRLGCVGGALRLIAQSEEGAALGITDRAVMAKFLRRRAEPTPDARTGGLYATESEMGAEALWDPLKLTLKWSVGIAVSIKALSQGCLWCLERRGLEKAAARGKGD